MNFWPYLVVIVVLGGLLVLSQRNRRRQLAAQSRLVEQLDVGSPVMTTSGLYATIVRRNDDDTVQLEIASGVEVRWAIAALREARTLPERYRPGAIEPGPPDEAENT